MPPPWSSCRRKPCVRTRSRPAPCPSSSGCSGSAPRANATPVLSTDASQNGNLRSANQKPPGDAVIMSKPTKTEAELIAMARAELKVHADCPDGIMIAVIRDGDTWEFRANADEATVAKPGYPECVAMLVQIGDHLSKQYDVTG